MEKRIFPPDQLKNSGRLAKGKSTYANNPSVKRRVIARGRVAKRVLQRKEE